MGEAAALASDEAGAGSNTAGPAAVLLFAPVPVPVKSAFAVSVRTNILPPVPVSVSAP